jgi:SAM-dependent methyltransferase
MPFRDGSFDATISSNVFEHIPNPQQLFKEMGAVTRTKGHLCIAFGPLWRSPFGGHLGMCEFFGAPWIHLFFPPQAIGWMLRTFRRFDQAMYDQFITLSRVTVNQYLKIISQKNFKVVNLKLVSYPPFNLLPKTGLSDYFTSQIHSVIQKT